MEDITPATIERALGGDRVALDGLVATLTPAIQAEVARALVRGGAGRGRDGRQEVLDATQEIFCALFAHEGRALRAWDPEKGRKLVSFVRLIAKRKVISMLRSNTKNPWADDPTEHDKIDVIAGNDGDALHHEDRDALSTLWSRLKPHLGERGVLLFQLLFVEQEDVEDVMVKTDMSRDAIYAWRSRLRKQARSIGQEMGLR
jgi:RNA polymerase sigma-70 factor (ECF subfamily)